MDTLLDLPWSNKTVDNFDINKARIELENDHFGLEKVKKRIIEYLAVTQLKNSLKGNSLFISYICTVTNFNIRSNTVFSRTTWCW